MIDKIVCSGALVYSISTSRFLLLQKAEGKHASRWGLVGGTNLAHENPWQGLHREIIEELGSFPDIKKTLPLEKFVSSDSAFNFHTYLCLVDSEFIPVLSKEHTAWGWFNIKSLPKPTHRGLESSLRSKVFRDKLQTVIDVINLIEHL